MLAKFAVANFRGFPSRLELDLTRPRDYEFHSGAIRDKVVKDGIIYGPNGCGKSNLGLAIFDLVNHLTQKMKQSDYYLNFCHAGSASTQVDFEYLFRLDGDELFYAYSKDAAGVLRKESLSLNGKSVFRRDDKGVTLGEAYPVSPAQRSELGANANNISILAFLWMSVPLQVDHPLIKLQRFVNSMLWFRGLRLNEFIGFDTAPEKLEKYFVVHGLLHDFESFLKRVSGQVFRFSSDPTGELLLCEFKGRKVPFQRIMSTGTGALELLYYWLKNLNRASFVFIDEFDAFYHFQLSFVVCQELFRLDCQVFLTSHNTYLMSNDLLRPDCNFILNRNKIKPLCDCTEKELRFGHNIEKLFRGGAFAV